MAIDFKINSQLLTMKINGYTCKGPTPQVLVIPKNGVEYIVRAGTLTTDDWEVFNKTYPKPTPEYSITDKNGSHPDVNNPEYKKAILNWTEAKTSYLVIKSLSATEGLEWDSVIMNDPQTWGKYTEDLIEAGFFDSEIAAMVNLTFDAQGLNVAKIEEATKSFLAREAANQS